MPKVSIIVPIYNVSKYLDKCLNSLTHQTLDDIEIICINDGSTDNSTEILNYYANKDHRIKILNQNNQGQGVARNNGIKLATGEYLGFVDPDDWIEPNMYEIMYLLAIKNECDTVYCNYDRLYEKSNRLEIADKFDEYNINIKPDAIFNWIDLKEHVLQNIPYICVNKIIKRKLIINNNIQFSEKRILGEDRLFSISTLLQSSRCIYTNLVMYHYIIHPNSSISILPSDPIFLINEVDDLLKQLSLEKTLSKEFTNFKKEIFIESYNREKNDEKKEYFKSLARIILDKKSYKQIRKKMGYKPFIQYILSLNNKYDYNNHKKIKILNILGLQITVKEEKIK